MSGFSSLKYKHVKHCSTHPKFLHSNSTSHRWAFGAIAELIDNAIDPDVNASQFCIDLKEFNNEPCLVLMDNGCGLTPERLHKMLSFGHSKKQLNPGDRSIGKHGNGFKSGTMRLGKDVLVLTKCAVSMTAGFLSQTFLAAVGAEDILIPLVSWDLRGNRLGPKHADIEESLQAICTYSIFPDEASLLAQLDAIPGTGTILIVSNLRRHEGVLEMDYKTDPHDIRITSEITNSHYQQLRPNQPHSTDVPSDYSLRAYVSILYKVPRMQIFIRDNKVKTKRISGILSQKVMETYRPMGVSEAVKIEMGFNTENRNLYGMMLYHRNRLIKPYMRVGMQLEENERGMGVLGIVEADFLQPTHNKQDFDDTTAYRRLLKKLSDVLAEYWWEKKERVTTLSLPPPETQSKRSVETEIAEDDVPDVVWVQCDNPSCLKWRILPEGTDPASLPDSWFCEYHPDPKYQKHEEAEQEWDMSVQHEIIERRRERKREYDRERKEKEAHKKRQRLEVIVGKEEQIMIQRQREALKKELEEQRARDALVLEQERKVREEEVLRLQKELEEMQAKRDRIQEQHNELLKRIESDALPKAAGSKRPADDNHVQFSEHEISQVGVSGSEDLSEERPVDSKKNEEASSAQHDDVLRLKWKEASTTLIDTDKERVSCQPLNQVADGRNEPLQNRAASFISLQTNEEATPSYQETGGLDGRVLEESRFDHERQQSHSAVQGSVLSSRRVAVNEPSQCYHQHHHHPLTLQEQQQQQESPLSIRNLDERRHLVTEHLEAAIVDTSGIRQNPVGGLQDMPPAFHHSKQQFSTEEMTGSHGNTLGPLSSFQNVNLSPTEGGRSLFQDGGRNLLSGSGSERHPVQYPLPVVPVEAFTEKLPDCPPSSCSDPLIVAGGSLTPRREAESSLVLSLQGRLRMALKTLLKIAGPTEVQSDVDGMLLTDLQVVTVCEKAKALVGMRWQAYEQEIAKLKTELAYTLADKLQQTGQGFRIRGLSGDGNWEPGMLK